MFTRSTPKIKTPNSIAVLQCATINDWKQWFLIRGESRSAPILLFLHGGPGTAQIAFIRRYMRELEKNFIVVNWDQRAAGLSYSGKISESCMNIEQFVADAYEVVQMLRRKFDREKIYLAGHSWGSVVGAILAARHPDLFHCYTGIGQIGNMRDNERLAYDFITGTARKKNDLVVLKAMEAMGPPPYRNVVLDMLHRGEWTSRYRAILKGQRVEFFFLKNLLFSSEYTLADRFRWLKGQLYSIRKLWPELYEVDLFERVPEFEIPVYFCLGRYDYTIAHPLSEKYFHHITAPLKKLIWFENSAHCPHWEEPEKFTEVMGMVLEECSARVEE